MEGGPANPMRHAEGVLLHAPGESPPTELLAALERHQVRIQATASTYAAAAEVCRRSSGPGSRERTVVLVLVEPERLHAPEALFHAMQRYAPRASVWMFDAGSTPRLRSATEDDARRWSRRPIERLVARPEGFGSARAETREPVGLRLTGTGPTAGAASMPGPTVAPAAPNTPPGSAGPGINGGAAAGIEAQGPITARQVLTDEELAMLLDDGGSRR